MKKTIALLLVLLLVIAATPAALAARAEEGRQNSYTMDFVLDTENKALNGTFDILAVNDSEDEWEELCLRDFAMAVIQELDGNWLLKDKTKFKSVTSVDTGNELEIRFDKDDASIVFVELEQALAPGESTAISIDFYADIPESSMRYSWNKSPDEELLMFELANFYPLLAIYEDGDWVCDEYVTDGEAFYSRCANYSVKMTLPEEYTVVASGDEQVSGDGNGMAEWSIEAQNMRDIYITASNNFSCVSDSWEGVEFNSYYFTEGYEDYNPKGNAEVMLKAAMDSMEFFTEMVGPYPYDELDLVIMSGMVGGMEYPSIVKMSNVKNYYDAYGGMFDEYGEEDYGFNVDEMVEQALIEVTAHEVGHQWFYAVVGSDSYNEAWLDEGITSFITMMFTMRDATAMDMANMVKYSMEWLEEDVGDRYINESYGELDYDYGTVVYMKGQYFMYELMQAMGEESFLEMFRDYYQTWSFKEASTKDFVQKVYEYDDSDEVKELIEKYIKL